MRMRVDDDYVKDSDIEQLPEGDWSLTLPQAIPPGFGLVPLQGAPGDWHAVIGHHDGVLTIYGVWLTRRRAIPQLLSLALAKQFLDVTTPDMLDKFFAKLPLDPLAASQEERNQIVEAWLREVGGQDAVDDPLAYLLTLLEHAGGKPPVVH